MLSLCEKFLSSREKQLLSEDDNLLLGIFSDFLYAHGQEQNPEKLTLDIMNDFFLNVLESGINQNLLYSSMTVIENIVNTIFAGQVPWSTNIFNFYKKPVQLLTIDNGIDLLKFFKQWDESQKDEQWITRFVLPTQFNEIIIIKQNTETENFQVKRYSNRVYFKNGNLLPFPPRDIINYNRQWEIVPGEINRLQRSRDQFFVFSLVSREAKNEIFNIKLLNSASFKCLKESKSTFFEELTFCIKLKSLEQYYLDWKKDKFYKEVLEIIDKWIERFKTESDENFLFNLQSFYARVYKLASSVYRGDKLFQKYIRELNTNIEFLKYKLDVENKLMNLATAQEDEFADTYCLDSCSGKIIDFRNFKGQLPRELN